MSSEPVSAVLARTSKVLLDFDGPICSVFSDFKPAAVAAELQVRLRLDGIPPETGMFDTLRYIARHRPEDIAKAEAELTRLEMQAVDKAEPTPATATVMRHFAESNREVAVVSNNSTAAVQQYLAQHDLDRFVTQVSSRTEADPDLLKPNPHLLLQAAQLLGVSTLDCMMVGDSTTDIEAAKAAGAAVVGYANKPGKRESFRLLQPDAIVDAMAAFLDNGVAS